MIDIFLVRHGESEGNINKSKYFEKLDCDIELTDRGRAQAAQAVDRIEQLSNFNHYDIFHSPYARAIQTMEIITDGLQEVPNVIGNTINDVKVDVRLREREWGNLRDIVTQGMKSEGHFNFFYRPNEGESFADAYNRAAAFEQRLNLVVRDNDVYKPNVVIVSHGELLKLFMMYCLNWSVEEFKKYRTPRNCEVFKLTFDQESGYTLADETPLSISHHYKQ